jgi:hypothetical protein
MVNSDNRSDNTVNFVYDRGKRMPSNPLKIFPLNSGISFALVLFGGPSGLHKIRCLALVASLVALIFGVSGCVTPVIPLPPPRPEHMSLNVVDQQQSLITINGIDPNLHDVLIFFFNQRTGNGVITRTSRTGEYASEPFEAIVGDRLDTWATRWTDDIPSSSICLVVVGDAQPEGLKEECPP